MRDRGSGIGDRVAADSRYRFLPGALYNAPMSRALPAVAVLWLVLIVVQAAPRNVGDASEYVAMAANLASGRPPALSEDDFRRVNDEFSRSAGGFELHTRKLAELRGGDGRYDMPHMWLYSLLAVPGLWLARALDLSAAWSFVVLNLGLVATLMALALHQGAGAWSLAIFASPLVWWLDKPLADLWIAFCLGIAALLWPARGPLVLVVLGLAAAQNPALAVAYLTFAVAAVVADPVRLLDRRWWGGLILGALAAGLAPAWYLWHLGRLSPLTTYVGATWPTASALLFPLTDINMGALVRFPPGAALVALALLRRDGWRHPAALPAAATALLLLGVISQQPNMNQGGNPDLSRYAIWLLPLGLPWLMSADRAPHAATRWLGMVLLIASAAWTITAFPPARPESYRYPTALAAWLWAHHPSWTAPRPEAFAERTSHREPGLVPTATPGCRKVLLFEGQWPAACPPPPLDLLAGCRLPGAFCYADASGPATYNIRAAGQRSWLGPEPHGRTWATGEPVAAWLAAIVSGLRTDRPDRARASLRGAWNVAWTETWQGDGRLVIYARDAGPGARLGLRHDGRASIIVRTPQDIVETTDRDPAAAPTMVAVPAGRHVVVQLRVQ